MQILSIQNDNYQTFPRGYYESWVGSEWIWLDLWHVATQKPIFEPEGGESIYLGLSKLWLTLSEVKFKFVFNQENRNVQNVVLFLEQIVSWCL